MQPSFQAPLEVFSGKSPVPEKAPLAAPATARARVLVVDDEPLVVEALAETLSREGYIVNAQVNPLSALECLRREQFAVIISDQRMPGLTGLDFLAQARELQPYASRILITGVLSLDTVIQAINKGEIYRFVVKPWLREEFLVTIRDAVVRHDLLAQNTALQSQMHSTNQELQARIALASRQNIELAQLTANLEGNLRGTVGLFARLLESFMPMLANQARRVQHLCQGMADLIKLPAVERQSLETAALLQDIGLIACSRSLIRRWHADPNSLSDRERSAVREHPVLGQELTSFAGPLAGVGALIRLHHERIDGSGFPDGLAGESIPWLGRVLAVAVAFAERNEQPARAANWMRSQSGSAFDAEAVRVLCQAVAQASVPRKQLQLLPSELRPGMLPARGVYSMNGELLAEEGQPLTISSIERVINDKRSQNAEPSLLVYC